MDSKVVSTWKYLRYVAGAAELMTEVVADLEIDLQKRNIDIHNETEPGEPPSLAAVGGLCFPPDRCMQDVAALAEYVGKLHTYVDKVFELTTEHVTAAREKGVTEYSYRVVGTPVIPTK